MATGEIVPLSPGEEAPGFTLTDIFSGEEVQLGALRGQVVVLNFWSGECPWSRQYDAIFAVRAAEWAEQGIRLLHIESNANEPPEEAARRAVELGVNAPILHDPRNEVADAYGALTTPHAFVIDPAGRVAYQGAVDDRSFRQREATVNYLDAAVEALLSGQPPDPAETPAYGCTIVRHFGD